MADKTIGLKRHAEEKSKLTLEKVDKAIRELSFNNRKVNFNSISQESGVSKTYLYKNKEVRQRIEELRQQQVSREMNQRAKYDKTSKSKDIIIMAKDKKIREIEAENKKLKEQLEILRGKLYEECN